jgi:hypothetical protein
MQNEFEMSLLGELSFFLGLQIHQSNQGIFISQTKYIREMLKRFGMEDCKPVITPMQTSCKLSKDDDSKSTDQRQYRSMIGNLLYVTTSRPDVMQAVGQVAWFQAAPKESHVLAVKRIFRYLKGTEEFGLWYPKGKDLSLIAYTDADWVGCIDDRRSTSGATFYLGECLVSWLRKKQSSISLSTIEAEYIAATTCCTQVLWMKQTLIDIQVEYDEPIPIYCDNTSAISISKNPVMHSKTKHIPIKYHFLWEQVAEKNIRVEYVGTKEQVADIFTKPLPQEAFEYLCQRLGVISTPKWMLFELFLNAYLICLRCTRGSTIRGQFSQGEQPRMERYLCHWWQRGRDLLDAEDRGMVPGGVDLSDAEEGKFIRYRGQRHGSRGSMSDMISVLHQSVAINAKGGDCWLRLVVIDVNPWRKPRSTKVWVMDPILFDVKMTHYCLVMVDKK